MSDGRPFDPIDRQTVQDIDRLDELGLWVYLRSRPATWRPREIEIRRRFGIGHEKYVALMSALRARGLIETTVERSGDGRISGRCTITHPYAGGATDSRLHRQSANPTAGKTNSRESGLLAEGPQPAEIHRVSRTGDQQSENPTVGSTNSRLNRQSAEPSVGKSDCLENRDLYRTERIQREDSTTATRGSRLALQELPAQWKAWTQENHPDVDPAETFSVFRDYWVAKPGKDGRKSDWFATWRNWCRKERPKPKPKTAPAEDWRSDPMWRGAL